MVSINKVSSSNLLSSLSNSAHVVSGLASGLDTEGMIESLVQSYQTKINSIAQKVTKTEWKQDAYRSIIAKMTAFSNKYTSYTSGTILLSSSFFSNAVSVESLGANKDRVSASGKSSSNIALNSVTRLATAARYTTSSNLNGGDGTTISADEPLKLDSTMTMGTLNGSLSLVYGNKTVSINFDEINDQLTGTTTAQKAISLGTAIRDKLSEQTITLSNGETVKASDRIGVTVYGDGTISFTDKSKAGNNVYISSASKSIQETLGLHLSGSAEDQVSQIKVGASTNLTKVVDTAEYLSEKTMNVNLNGTTKTIKMPKMVKEEDGAYKILDADGNKLDLTGDNYAKVLQDSMEKAFGKKIQVSNKNYDGATTGSLNLEFTVDEGSSLLLNTDAGDTLGIGKTASSYMDTSKTLGKLLGDDAWKGLTPSVDKDGKPIEGKYDFVLNGVTIGSYGKDTKLYQVINDINANSEAGVRVSYSQTTNKFLFTSQETGSETKIEMGDGLANKMFGVDESKLPAGGGSFAEAYGMTWMQDGESARVSFGFKSHTISFNITKEMTIADVAKKLNPMFGGQGEKAYYDKYSGQLLVDGADGQPLSFTIKDQWDDEVQYKGESTSSYTAGQDAKLNVTINGETMDLVRGSNLVSIDGLTLSLKETFDGYKDADGNAVSNVDGHAANAVTFSSKTDSDKIVDAVRSMVKDYNEMMAEIKAAYGTMPAKNSSGSLQAYEPLTDDEKAGMSESAIQRYEEKAKQGILFGDRNLSGLYDRMREAFAPAGRDGDYLRHIGISLSYSSDGSMSLSLDENALREALDSDPEAVADAFTKSRAGGSSSDGVMQNMKTQLDRYAGLTGSVKGILVQEAGTPLNALSLLNNNFQNQIDKYNDQIESWQEKLSAQVDRYTSQFTRLEMLINQMNSQSSTLAGLMGG